MTFHILHTVAGSGGFTFEASSATYIRKYLEIPYF